MKYIKLSEYAKLKSVTYKTAWNRFIGNKLVNSYKDETGHVYVGLDDDISNNKVIVYARVSSNERKQSLKEQQSRLGNMSKHIEK